MTGRNGTHVDWNSDNLPTCMDSAGGHCSASATTSNSLFSYAPDKHRYKQVAMVNGSNETTIYAGGLEIITDSNGTHYRHTISAYGKPVLLENLENSNGSSPTIKQSYTLTDHLGSVDAVINDVDSGVEPRESFDTFGQRRDAGTWSGAISQTDLTNARKVTHHGFTHHEHLDNLAGLIHANGRVLDSVTGRFLSVDPIYQAPTNSQSVNPYSYVMNNSLSLVDPSGYEATPDSMNIAQSGSSGHPLAPIENPQGDTSVTLDYGSEGGVSGEGGRDSDGNLIKVISASSIDHVMQLADGRVVAQLDNGDDYVIGVAGGNGATSGSTAPAATTSNGTNGNANASSSASQGSIEVIGTDASQGETHLEKVSVTLSVDTEHNQKGGYTNPNAAVEAQKAVNQDKYNDSVSQSPQKELLGLIILRGGANYFTTMELVPREFHASITAVDFTKDEIAAYVHTHPDNTIFNGKDYEQPAGTGKPYYEWNGKGTYKWDPSGAAAYERHINLLKDSGAMRALETDVEHPCSWGISTVSGADICH